MMKLIQVFFLLGSFSSAIAQQNSLLWQVSGNGLNKPSYLFGTYHLEGAEFLDEVKGAHEALKLSEAVVGELEIDGDATGKMMTYMVMENNQLDSLLSPAEYDSVAEALKERVGIPLMMMNKIKPMGIYLFLASGDSGKEVREDMKAGKEPMDMWIQTQAKNSSKPIKSLETLENQAELLFNSSTIERQKEMLMEYLRMDKKAAQAENDKIESCYKKQDLECLVAMMESADYTEIERDVLLKDRNLRWMPQLTTYMTEQSCFVAVGALHLAGESGLITLLRNQGYTVKPILSKKDLR